MQQKLIILQGLPASGKSTWARNLCKENPNYIRVCRDDIRNMLTPNFKFGGEMEHLVTQIEYYSIEQSLESGYSVVVDDTNLNPKYIKKLTKIADKVNTWYGAFERVTKCQVNKIEVEIINCFLEVPLKECIIRDALREKFVGEAVIMRMYNQYVKNRI